MSEPCVVKVDDWLSNSETQLDQSQPLECGARLQNLYLFSLFHKNIGGVAKKPSRGTSASPVGHGHRGRKRDARWPSSLFEAAHRQGSCLKRILTVLKWSAIRA